MEVKVVERSLQIQVQEQEIVRRDRELEATVKKPAEAEVFRLTKIAEANKNKVWVVIDYTTVNVLWNMDVPRFGI